MIALLTLLLLLYRRHRTLSRQKHLWQLSGGEVHPAEDKSANTKGERRESGNARRKSGGIGEYEVGGRREMVDRRAIRFASMRSSGVGSKRNSRVKSNRESTCDRDVEGGENAKKGRESVIEAEGPVEGGRGER